MGNFDSKRRLENHKIIMSEIFLKIGSTNHLKDSEQIYHLMQLKNAS